jgi:hypothetical protein
LRLGGSPLSLSFIYAWVMRMLVSCSALASVVALAHCSSSSTLSGDRHGSMGPGGGDIGGNDGSSGSSDGASGGSDASGDGTGGSSGGGPGTRLPRTPSTIRLPRLCS